MDLEKENLAKVFIFLSGLPESNVLILDQGSISVSAVTPGLLHRDKQTDRQTDSQPACRPHGSKNPSLGSNPQPELVVAR